MLEPFFIRHNRKLKRIDPMDVLGLASQGSYTCLVLSNKTKYLVRSSLAAALEKLPPNMFVKIHRSSVVSIYHIDKIARDHLIIGDEVAGIGKPYYKGFVKRLNVIE